MMIKLLATCVLFVCFWHSACAEESPLAQLKSFLSHSASMSADFQQVSLDKAGHPGKSSYGKFYLNRPGKFRWNYEKPFVQEIVSNGGKVWFYDADLEQVTVKNLDDSLGSTPALLLTGQVNLEEKFKLEEQGKDTDMNWIKLVPKDEESGFKYVLIGLNAGQLAGMELSDNFGQLTRIYFTNIQLNPTLNADMFNFKPPKGADVFGN
ncbi:outer membrane lipoprotein chaperone LolA [Methylomonas sp. AM2-LC]|uniref:outer membrane lipoprotein chaperone LolA n=1 Tax=Methylomonas sp. AM2-LC TaxID=3153301 RepID=UPI00326776C0